MVWAPLPAPVPAQVPVPVPAPAPVPVPVPALVPVPAPVPALVPLLVPRRHGGGNLFFPFLPGQQYGEGCANRGSPLPCLLKAKA